MNFGASRCCIPAPSAGLSYIRVSSNCRVSLAAFVTRHLLNANIIRVSPGLISLSISITTLNRRLAARARKRERGEGIYDRKTRAFGVLNVSQFSSVKTSEGISQSSIPILGNAVCRENNAASWILLPAKIPQPDVCMSRSKCFKNKLKRGQFALFHIHARHSNRIDTQ